MTKNIPAIIAIFVCTAVAWVILGSTIMARSFSKGEGLESRVSSTWGAPQTQAPPQATTARVVPRIVTETVDGRQITKSVDETITTPLALERSRVRVHLDLEQRKKGLLWFPTYRVAFHGAYVFRNLTDSEDVSLRLVFPAPDAIYDDLVFRVDGRNATTSTSGGSVGVNVRVPRGSVVSVETGYRSQGLETWQYVFGENVVQVRDFALEMTTDFDSIDFPAGSVSPTTKRRDGRGWSLTWRYNNLVTGYRIGMTMPEKLQPGPLAGRISLFAPVSLLFFFFMMFIICSLRQIELHPMHYFFLATSFFSFHLLIAYLVDHISIHLAFAISSVVSIFLVVSYLRIVVGTRFAFLEAATAQLVYLVGFSYAFFFNGFTGLAVTIGAIMSLFIVMQLTARLEWRRKHLHDAPAA